jgi:hypothetical protein
LDGLFDQVAAEDAELLSLEAWTDCVDDLGSTD